MTTDKAEAMMSDAQAPLKAANGSILSAKGSFETYDQAMRLAEDARLATQDHASFILTCMRSADHTLRVKAATFENVDSSGLYPLLGSQVLADIKQLLTLTENAPDAGTVLPGTGEASQSDYLFSPNVDRSTPCQSYWS